MTKQLWPVCIVPYQHLLVFIIIPTYLVYYDMKCKKIFFLMVKQNTKFCLLPKWDQKYLSDSTKRIVTCYCCVSTLSCKNAILSDITMYGLSFHFHATTYQAVIDFHSKELCCLWTPIGLKLVRVRRLWEKHKSCYSGRWRQLIIGASKWQFSDWL
jgi:hypothetical protein